MLSHFGSNLNKRHRSVICGGLNIDVVGLSTCRTGTTACHACPTCQDEVLLNFGAEKSERGHGNGLIG